MTGLTRRLFAPVDIASTVAFRIMFGTIMLWEVWRYFETDWIARYYIEPVFHFTYYGFGWVHPWPGNGMYVHFLVVGILAFCILVGFFYRVCTVLFFLGFTYIFLLDQANYLNHFYFVSLISFLMIFVPAHRSVSLDAWLRPALRSETIARWPLFLLKAQIAIMYIGAGVAKINRDFLAGEPLRTWLAERGGTTLFGPLLPIGKLFTQEWVVYFFSYGGLLFDLFVAPAMLCRRTRPYAFAASLFFHLMNAHLFSIGIFPWFSIAATLLFFDPDWPRRVLNWPRRGADLFRETAVGISPARCAAVLSFTSIYLAIQVLMPLRHFLYPGYVSWTEEGHRFSWHMKLRDKEAAAMFEATDPATGETWRIDLAEHLSTRQRQKMSKRTDMILQFAHYLSDYYRREQNREVEIRARIYVSLNNRPPAMLIDPTVNLAVQPRTLWPAPWILPLEPPDDDERWFGPND